MEGSDINGIKLIRIEYHLEVYWEQIYEELGSTSRNYNLVLLSSNSKSTLYFINFEYFYLFYVLLIFIAWTLSLVIIFKQLSYTKTNRFHAILFLIIIKFSD